MKKKGKERRIKKGKKTEKELCREETQRSSSNTFAVSSKTKIAVPAKEAI